MLEQFNKDNDIATGNEVRQQNEEDDYGLKTYDKSRT